MNLFANDKIIYHRVLSDSLLSSHRVCDQAHVINIHSWALLYRDTFTPVLFIKSIETCRHFKASVFHLLSANNYSTVALGMK